MSRFNRFVEEDPSFLSVRPASVAEYLHEKVFCPTGPGGGINPGCPANKDNYSALLNDGYGNAIPGTTGHMAGVDTSGWTKGKPTVNWALKKIAKLEKAAWKGKWGDFEKQKSKMTIPYKAMSPQQKAVWDAQNNLEQLKEKKITALPDDAIPTDANPAVASGENWKKVGDKLGTEKGGIYEMGGKKYYVKTPDDVNRTHNEILANKLYALAGGGVMKASLVEIDGKPAYAHEWEEGISKANWNSSDTKAKAAEDFAIHAWLNNRDAVGAGTENPMDNIRFREDGSPVTVDVGGALDYKGMGGSGKKDFTTTPTEWNTLRDPSINPTMAKVFGDMTPAQLVDSAAKLEAVSDQQIMDAVKKYANPANNHANALMVETLIGRKKAILAYAESLKPKPSDVPQQKPTETDSAYVSQLEKKKQDADKQSGPVSVTLPAPPFLAPKLAWAANINPKMQALHDAASAGNLAGVVAVKTNGNSKNSYSKKLHKYKEDLLATMTKGGTPVPTSMGVAKTPNVAVDPKPPIKINPDALPAEPDFLSSNQGMVAFNKNQVAQLLVLAKAGDLDSLSKAASDSQIPGTLTSPPQDIKSPKVKNWVKTLLTNVSNQLNPPPPPVPLSETMKAVTSKIGTPSTYAGKEKIGYWKVLDSIPTQETVADGKWLSYADADPFHSMGKVVAKKMGVMQLLKNYTGSAYHDYNDSLRFNKGGESTKTNAEKMAKAIIQKGMDLPEGVVLSRKYTPEDDIVAHIDSLTPGKVISDAGLLSTSFQESKWHGKIHFKLTIGPGVKGIAVDNFSSNSGEQEVIMASNQRIMVTKVDKSGGSPYKVHAVVLPTLENQCCPP